MAKEHQSRDALQAELLLEARVAVFDTKKAELVAQKILAQHSTKMKVALSELVLQTAQDFRSGEVRPKDRALAMVALKTVSNQLYGWDQEPDLQRMKRVGTSYAEADYMPEDFPPTGAVNLRLIATTPEQLAQMAKAKRDGQWGAPATECNGQGLGPIVVAPEEPPAATHGRPISEEEAPKPPPEGQSAKGAVAGHPVWETPRKPSDDVTHPAPLSQTPFGQTPPSFDRARAERRKENREKYREKYR
jgi:hypothetical protein